MGKLSSYSGGPPAASFPTCLILLDLSVAPSYRPVLPSVIVLLESLNFLCNIRKQQQQLIPTLIKYTRR